MKKTYLKCIATPRHEYSTFVEFYYTPQDLLPGVEWTVPMYAEVYPGFVRDEGVQVYLIQHDMVLSLVELPSEAVDGSWRVWVLTSHLTEVDE